MKRFSLLLLAVSLSSACVQSALAAPKFQAMRPMIDPSVQTNGTGAPDHPLQAGITERAERQSIGLPAGIQQNTTPTARPIFIGRQRDGMQNETVQPPAAQRPLSGQASQPWNVPTGSWHVDQNNPSTTSAPWNVPSGGWQVQSGGWGQQAQPQTPVAGGGWNVPSGGWNVQSGSWKVPSGQWNVQSGPWNAQSGPWNVQAGTWPESKQGNWNQKNEPWHIQDGPWGLQSGSWGLQMGSWNLQIGPWGVRSL